jgi:U2 small nuclear ribonucleoprotein A'
VTGTPSLLLLYGKHSSHALLSASLVLKGRQYYRLYAIHHIPSLKTLDFVRIKPAERDRASRLASSAAGAALESDVHSERLAAKSFVPGEGVETNGGRSFVAASFTTEQKDMIRDLLGKASSVQEVEEIENAVRRGVLPNAIQLAQPNGK